MKQKDIKPGIYKHFKGGEYEVLFTALDSESKDELVIYRSIKDSKIWARSSKIFNEDAELEGKKIPRFIFMSQASDPDKEKFEDIYKRALADYQNLLKRTALEKSEFAKYANENLIQDILPVYDHLKMSIAGLPESEKGSAWVTGVEYVIKQFGDILNQNGVEEIKTDNNMFDHHTMEAVSEEMTPDEKLEGKVSQVLVAGYKLRDKVIRPARVSVYKLNQE